MLNLLKKGLVVSCQPVDHGPMDRPDIVCAMAQAAIEGGAAGVRIEGVENVRATRAGISQPIVGIVKRDLEDSPIRITPFLEDAADLAQAGADIIAYDATHRDRAVTCRDIVQEILKHNCLAMADCATVQDAMAAIKDGAHIIGTTLSGYTDETYTLSVEPDLELVKRFKQLGAFVMAEGRYATPTLAGEALVAGADCVTVGTPLTRLEVNTAAFQAALSHQGTADAAS